MKEGKKLHELYSWLKNNMKRAILVASGKNPDKIDKVRITKVKKSDQHNKKQEVRWWDDKCNKS